LSEQPLIGIDIGGTKIAVAAITSSGRILGCAQAPVCEQSSLAAFNDTLITLVRRALAEGGLPGEKPAAIGIGCTGPVDPAQGTVSNPYTLPLPMDSDITTPLRKAFDAPVLLENDAFAAALGEAWLGAARGRELAVCVTFGTGIGCGVVRAGRLQHGARGHFPEIGHQILDPTGPPCYCGASGCWESLASGTAIGQAGQRAAQGPGGEALLALAGGRAEAVDARLVFQAARSGDPVACHIVERAVRATAAGVHNLVHAFAPDAIVLGGGMMCHYDLFEPAARAAIARITIVPVDGLLIAPAELGANAGLYGAARLAALSLGN